MSMNERIIIAGFGGQGVLSMGKMLVESAMAEGRHVTWLPSYGPEMRGGTSNCHVNISDEEIGSPVIESATTVIVMNQPSLDKFQTAVEPGGMLFINSSIIESKSTRDDIKVFYIPANDIAMELGSMQIANMAMLGAYLAATGIVSSETLIAQLAEVLGERKAHLVPLNRQAIEKGASFVK